MRKLLVACVFFAALATAGATRAEHGKSVGGLTVEHAWARATAGHAKAASAYLTIRNESGADDRLLAVAADAVAGMAMLHTNIMQGDVMKMRPVDGIDIKTGQTATLKPGGYHVMLMGLKAPLKEGQHFPLTLKFEKAGPITVEVEVEGVGARGEGHGRPHQ